MQLQRRFSTSTKGVLSILAWDWEFKDKRGKYIILWGKLLITSNVNVYYKWEFENYYFIC